MISYADRNNVAQQLVKQADRAENSGSMIEGNIAPGYQKVTVGIEQVRRQIEAAGGDLSLVPTDVLLSVWKLNQRPDRQNNQATVTVNGEQRIYQFSPEIIASLDALEPPQVPLLIKLLSIPASLTKFGATGAGPEFLLRNPMRDAMEAYGQSDNGFKPILDSLFGAWTQLFDKGMVDEWLRNGGGGAGIAPISRQDLRHQLDAMHMSKGRYIVRHPSEIFSLMGDVLRVPGEFTERMTRLGEYRKAINNGKGTDQAVFDSRNVSLDFSRQGLLSRWANMVIPYFSATVNGSERFIGLHNPKNPKRFARTFARGIIGTTIPSLILWALNHGDADYEELEPWRKNFFWNVPVKHLLGGEELSKIGKFIMIPRAHLFGLVYGNLPERMMESFYAHNPKAFNGFLKDVSGVFTPDVLPAILKSPVEVAANHSFFTGRPIESKTQSAVSAQYRQTPGTSESAKATSRMLNGFGVEMSPMMVDHLFMGYTAGLGRAALVTGESLLGVRGNRPTLAASETPILRAIFSPKDPAQPESVNELYDKQQKLERRAADFKLNQKFKDGPAEDAEPLPPAEKAELARYRKATKELSAIYASTLQAQYDNSMSPQQKRSRIDELNAKRAGIARKALGK